MASLIRSPHCIIMTGKIDIVKENEKVTVEYKKTQLSFGGYRPERVIWITLLNGQRVVKFNLLDQAGNVLYRIEEKMMELK